MTSEPWYQNGLQFACTQCGNCCTGNPGYVWVTDEDIERIAEYLNKPVGEIRLLHSRLVRGQVSLKEFANGDCIYFDGRNRRCTIYPVRPMQCRTWPFWRVNLDTERAWDETARECPGIGQGPLYDLVQIDTALNKTRL